MTQILIGTNRVGLVGLRGCLQKVSRSDLEGKHAIIDLMMEELSLSNYIPNTRVEEYRTAMWREHLRHRGEDFSEFYSELPVGIRGGSKEERHRLARMITAALAEHELRPSMTVVPAPEEDLELVLDIDGEVVVRGLPTLNGLRKAVRHRLSDW